MKQTVYILKGLPASGKTNWALDKVRKSNGKCKRICKDDLRAMVDGGQYSKDNEKLILKIRDDFIWSCLIHGYDIIIDDTNLNPIHEKDIRDIVEDYEERNESRIDFDGVELKIQRFFTPLEECIKRDSERENPVGEKVIRDMHKRWRLEPEIHVYQKSAYNEKLPDCIIVDMDGTLAHMNGRSPYDYSLVGTDCPDDTIIDIVETFSLERFGTTHIFFVSGRPDSCRNETEAWLQHNYSGDYKELYMRKEGDKREDSIIKKELYENYIKDKYNVLFVLDDRDRVVKMWRDEGLKCLQVQPGNF